MRANLWESFPWPLQCWRHNRILKLLYISGSHSPGNPGPDKASEGPALLPKLEHNSKITAHYSLGLPGSSYPPTSAS
ncbi:transmembrane protein 78-like [Symphalangus syndactylus]|uniref:transmembrane protein 78-like n=1 Tax=Symphalangus syndactylus TaxID=9590 RepID=UPI002441C3BA|nr:transmembrane protein 78-like [Symphalangus syndactylus]